LTNFPKRMNGYNDPRTLYQSESIIKWEHNEYFPPIMVEIDPSDRCNQKCRFCYNQSKVENVMIRDDVLLDLPNQLAKAGVKAILYQGSGEPLMHKKLADTIINGHRMTLVQTLTTNGVLFKPEIQDRILDKLHYIRFSVLESDPKRYSFLHGVVEKQWHMLIKNLEYAINLRAKRNLDIVLMGSIYLEEINFHYAYAITEFFKELGMDYLIIQEAVYGDYSPAGDRKYPSESFTPRQIRHMIYLTTSLNDENFHVKIRFPINDDTFRSGLNKDTFKNGFCQGIKFTAVIGGDGNVYPCWRAWGNPEMSYGSLYEHTFEEIWKSNQRQEVVEWILYNPPDGNECVVCNNWKTNTILDKYKNSTAWKDFLI